MPDRIYSDREVAAIIERAADRQRRAPLRDDAPGLTLAEIEKAGREAGLDPDLLRSAAADLDAGLLAPTDGPGATTVAERWVEGPLRPGAWEDEVAALRLRAGDASSWAAPEVTYLGADLEWSFSPSFGIRTTVSVSPRGGRTRVRVARVASALADPGLQGAALGAFVTLLPALLAGAFTAEGLGLGDPVGVAVMLLVLAAGLALGATWGAARLRRRREGEEDVDELADGLVRRLFEKEAVGEEAGPVRPADEGRIDPALLDDEADAPESSGSRGRRART